MAFNPQDLFNKYKNILSGGVNKLSSFVQQNPLPAGYAVKKFQETAKPIVQKMTQFQAPFEQKVPQLMSKLPPKLQQPVQNAFPVTAFPSFVGENVRQAGRLLSLQPKPLDIAMVAGPTVVGKVAALRQGNKVNKAVELLRNKLTSEDVSTIGKFSELIETGKGRQEMGELGQTIHSLAKNVFGKKAETWSNQKIKNIFDVVLGKIGEGPNTAGLGLTVKELRKIPISSLKKADKLLLQQEGKGSLIEPGIRTKMGETISDNKIPQKISKLGQEELSKLSSYTKIVEPTKVQTKKLTQMPTAQGGPEIAPLTKTPISSQETLEKAAQVKLQQKVATGQLPPNSPSLPDIIKRSEIDVKDKINLWDKYGATPDRVLKKVGLENEAIMLRKSYNKYLDELPVEINKVTNWSKQVPKESNQRIFQYLDGKKIDLNSVELKVANEIKSYLREWANKLKLPQEKRITNYITHIFDKDFIKKEFDPELAKLIENRVPGSVYDPFTEQRLGKMGYREDTWAALDAYIKRGVRKYNMDDVLNTLKEKSNSLEKNQYKYIQNYASRINLRPTETDEIIDNTIKQIFGYKYGVRPTSQLTRNARQAVYRGTLGLNVGSALKNLTQGANTYAKLGEKYTILGYMKNAFKMFSSDDELKRVGVLRDEFIQDRTLNATKKFWEKVDKGLFAFFETAERINRGAAYYGAKAQALDKGATEQQAIDYALKMVRDTQFTFGVIDTPPILSSDIGKLLLQFQSFTLKQGEFLGEMVANKEYAGLVRYALASALMATTVGKLIGMEWKDFIPSVRIGFPPTLQAPFEIGKAIVGAPDKYGNIPDLTERVENVGNALVPLIPGGVQIKKTLQGLGTVDKGYSESKTGRIRTPIDQGIGNKIRGGLFGQYNLPEMRNYFDKDMKVLGEKQSAIFKELNPEQRQQYFDNIQKNREEKKKQSGLIDQAQAAEEDNGFMIDVAKERVKLSGDAELVGANYVYKEGDSVKTLNLDHTVNKPELTGQTELDKKKVSNYKSKITSEIGTVVKLQELGVYTPEQAEKLIQDLKSKSTAVTGTKAKKPKKITFKKVSYKIPKVSVPKVKKVKVSKPKKLSLKKYTIKTPKLSKSKLKKSAKLT